MKPSNNILLSLTGIVVKTYMLIAIVWSKRNERKHRLSKNIPAAAPRLSIK